MFENIVKHGLLQAWTQWLYAISLCAMLCGVLFAMSYVLCVRYAVAMVFVKAGFKMKTDYKESEFSTNVSVHCSHKNTPNSTQLHITNGWACQEVGRANFIFVIFNLEPILDRYRRRM